MDKHPKPQEEGNPFPADIEFWEDDCGLSDLAKDAFDQLKKCPEQAPAKTAPDRRREANGRDPE